MIKYMLSALAKDLKDKNICDCTPTRGTCSSVGMDLKACLPEPISIYPGEVHKIPLGVHIFLGVLPEEKATLLTSGPAREDPIYQLAGLYLPRSSCSGLKLENTVGLLDPDYQGESFAKYRNVSDMPIRISPGERIVQLVIVPAIMTKWLQVSSFEETTKRGHGGDGSTGK